MLKVGLVFPSQSAFAVVPALLEQVNDVSFDVESQNYDFFFEILSQVALDVAIICVDQNSTKPLEIMSLIRTTYPNIRIVSIASTDLADTRDAALSHGAQEVLSLPVSRERLAQILVAPN
jgi:DNA-binding NarL/FixJ family response regulator